MKLWDCDAIGLRIGTALICLLTQISGAFALEPGEGKPVAERPVVMGYLASWNAGSDGQRISDIPAEHLTHLFYAFGAISAEGVAELADPCLDAGACTPDATAPWAGNFGQLAALKRRHPELKVLVSLGGWTGSQHFAEIAATVHSRDRFVRSVIEVFIVPYPGLFDGIDIDWEYPVAGGMPENARGPEDRQNFTRLMVDFRRELDRLHHPEDREYLLSIATSADLGMIANIEPAKLAETVDWINVMTYDYHAGSAIAHFNAPLFSIPRDTSPHANVDASIRAYVQAGVPRSKLVLGIPFYGRGYGNVEPAENGLLQPADPQAAGEWGNEGIDYRTLMAKQPEANGFSRFWNEFAQAPFLYNAEARLWISYEDERSVALKATYARRNRLAGVMFWELGGDDGSLLRAISVGLDAHPAVD